MFKQKKAAPATVEFDLRSDTEFVTWDDKVRELRAKESALDREESALLEKLNSRPAAPAMDRKVAALLGEEVAADDPAPDGLGQRLREVQADRRSVKAARDIAEERRHHARRTASGAICAAVAPEYKQRVKALADALLVAKAAAANLDELRHQLNHADVAWSGYLRVIGARFLGDRGDRVDAFLKEAKTYGLIEEAR